MSIPPSSFKSGSMVPELCMQQCGPSQLALIAPTVENIWDFYCSCVSSVPVAAAPAEAPLECNVKCPGAAIPSQAPPCGGTFNGQISWSAYGNLSPGFGFIAPESGSDSVVPSIRSEPPVQPSSVVATIQPTVTLTLVDDEGGRPQQSITLNSLSSPSASATTISTAMELGVGSLEGSNSEQTSDHLLHPSSTLNSSTVPKANGAIAPAPSTQDDGGKTTLEKTNGVIPSIGFIAGGFIAAIVILAVGFTVMVQQRKPHPLFPKKFESHQYGDQTGLIHGPSSSELEPFDDGESVSSVSIPAQAVQPNMSYSKNDSPPVLLYGLASKSTNTVDTLNNASPEISFGSPSRTVALGAMPDNLKTALNSNETMSIATTVPINHHHHHHHHHISGGGGGVGGGGGSIRPSYYSGVSLYSQLSRLYRRSVGASSVAASSLFMRGMARNMAGEEEGARGVRQDVFYTQRRS
ncbi:hypothetical protein HDU78_000725 [Chytriomyces hyalinus]|nr:hypothetical protein HDU78_000725 [Chytriomyces hyalinus]